MEKQNPINLKEILLITALTLIGTLLLIYELDRPLSGDEGRTFNRYGLLSWKVLLFLYDDTSQHSLFSVLSNLCLQLLGENEIVFRLPSFLAGVLAVPLIYYLSRSLNNSRSVSFCSSCLLILSQPHMTYSQVGRGYSLTVFLALILILACTKLLSKKNYPLFWGPLLVLSGFCMVITLPSNVYFLTTAGVFCFTTLWFNKEENGKWLSKNFISVTISFLVLLIFAGMYLAGIYPLLMGFVDSWKEHSQTKPTLSLFFETTKFLISPWSPWLYTFTIIGYFSLKSKTSVALFTSVFVTPLSLVLFINVGGFPRTFIYILPFILILTALGIFEIIRRGKNFNPLLGRILTTLIIIGVAFPSTQNLILYYEKLRTYSPNTSMAEAQKASSYAQKNIPLSNLIVLSSPDSDVLNHYLQKQIQDSALLFILGKKPERIIFVTRRNQPPWNHSVSGDNGNLTVAQNAVKQIATLGGTHIYELNRTVHPFIPSSNDPDYETKLLNAFDSPDIKIRKEEDRKIMGQQSLLIKNYTGKTVQLKSSSIKHVDIAQEGAFILTFYIRTLTQQSTLFLMNSNTNDSHPLHFARLLPANKNFQTPANNKDLISDKTNNLWEKAFFLYPLSKGRHSLTEVFNLIHNDNYFDGVKSYILTK
jgi:hypothetical protein